MSGELREALKGWAAKMAAADSVSIPPEVKAFLDSWARAAVEVKTETDATADFYRGFVRLLSGEDKGENITIADVAVRGPLWGGWNTAAHGIPMPPETVSEHFRESAFLVDTLAPLATFSPAEGEVLSWAIAVERHFEVRKDDARWNLAVALEPAFVAARSLRDSAAAALTAAQECFAVWKRTLRELPPAEIEAARARLEAEAAAKVNPATDEGKPGDALPIPGVNDLPLGEKHIKQEEVAAACGVGVRTVRNWEYGIGRPPLGYSRELRLSWNAARFAAWVSNFKLNVGVADKLKFQTATGTGNRYRNTGATWQEAR